MKKKIFTFTTAILLLMIMCVSLVSCDNPTSKYFKFSDDMTIEEVEDAIGQLKSFTIEVVSVIGWGTEHEHLTTYMDNLVYYFGDSIINTCGVDLDPNSIYGSALVNHVRVYEFWEDGVFYTFSPGTSQYRKINADKEEFDRYRFFSKENYSWYKFWVVLESGDYAIADGNLYVGKLTTTDGWLYSLRDMNNTNVELPSEFSDYKSREFTE